MTTLSISLSLYFYSIQATTQCATDMDIFSATPRHARFYVFLFPLWSHSNPWMIEPMLSLFGFWILSISTPTHTHTHTHTPWIVQRPRTLLRLYCLIVFLFFCSVFPNPIPEASSVHSFLSFLAFSLSHARKLASSSFRPIVLFLPPHRPSPLCTVFTPAWFWFFSRGYHSHRRRHPRSRGHYLLYSALLLVVSRPYLRPYLPTSSAHLDIRHPSLVTRPAHLIRLLVIGFISVLVSSRVSIGHLPLVVVVVVVVVAFCSFFVVCYLTLDRSIVHHLHLVYHLHLVHRHLS
ncbi:hypothetical protein K474DRAFT_1652928 [Panus rudis PR-1116 ss-1]|nr:hypothetical protein K474DRAFT_1652928 [Panus rudis PR-1116 ss-1]